MTINTTLRLTLSSLTLMASASVMADPPHRPDLVSDGNRWTITGYYDNSPNHTQAATQGICFYPAGVSGTHQLYTWVSDTYPDWNGRAAQEGDQVFMHGDFQWPYGVTRDGGHDSMEWEIVTMSRRNEGAGHWREWIEDGGFGVTIAFGNAKLQRVGKCKHATAEEALEAARQLDLPRDSEGNYLYNPLGIKMDSVK